MSAPLVLITRPAEDAQSFAKDVQALELETFIAPMLSIEFLDVDLPNIDKFQALIFTSANAVRGLADKISDTAIPVYTVGARTAEEAKNAGFTNVYSAGGNVNDLVRLITENISDTTKPLLYLSGEYTARSLDELLSAQDIELETIVLYTQKQTSRFGEALIKILEQHENIFLSFFSKRTADTFLSLARTHNLLTVLGKIKILCISNEVLKCVQHHNWAGMHVSQTPDRAGMIALIKHVRNEDMTKDNRAMSTSSNNSQAIENAEKIIEKFGGIRPMAKKMEVAVTTVQGWKKRNVIPANRRGQVIEAAGVHNIDISEYIDGAAVTTAPEASPPANENAEEKQPITLSASVSTPVSEAPVKSELSAAHTSENPNDTKQDKAFTAHMAQVEEKTVNKTLWVNVVFILVSIAAVLALLWPSSTKQTQEITEIKQEVSALQGDVTQQKSLLSSILPEDMSKQLETLQEQASEIKEQAVALKDDAVVAIEKVQEVSGDVLAENAGTINERIAVLQYHADDVLSSERFQSLRTRFDGMNESLFGQQKLETAASDLNTAVGAYIASGVQTSSDEFTQMLEGMRAQSAPLNEAFEGVPTDDLQAAALLLGFTQLRGALNRDNDPFEDDLQLLMNLVGEDNPELLGALEKLAPHAQDGVLTPSGLSAEFKDIAGDVVVSSLKGEDVSVQEKASARLNELFQVEKDGALQTGTDTQKILHTANKHVEEGNIAAAIEALSVLEGQEAQAVQPWVDDANASLAVEEIKLFLEGAANPDGTLIQDKDAGINILTPGPGFDHKSLYE